MALLLSGVKLGNLTNGPTSWPSVLRLEDLSDISISSPQTGDYLRYNVSTSQWQNRNINTEVYGYLNTNLIASNGISIVYTSATQTLNIALSLATSGDATGSSAGGLLPITLATVNTSPGVFGSSTTIPVITVNGKGLVTSITNTPFNGNAPTSTNIVGGATGSIPYQSAANTTTFLLAGTPNEVLVSGPNSPTWTNTPTLTGTHFSSIPNNALINNSITIGSTNIALGTATTSLVGLTSVSVPIITLTNGGLTTITYTSSANTANQIIDSLSINIARTVKYLVQVTSSIGYQACEILIIQDGTTAWLNTYSEINTGVDLASFDASVTGNNLNLLFTPINPITTVKLVRISINI